MTMSCDDAGTKPFHRLEVFTGAGHRREWSEETRSAIIAASYAGAESVSAVARRCGLAPSQLFTWRRDFRRTSRAAAVASAATPVAAPFFVHRESIARIAPAAPPRTNLRPSPPLSILAKAQPTLQGRMIGCLVADGMLAPEGGNDLARETAAVAWVHDAFAHVKVIGFNPGAVPLMEAAGAVLGGQPKDGGVVALANGNASNFLDVASRGRVWAREPTVRKSY